MRFKVILIAGLGNPGKEYENTKHNIGFKIVSKLTEKYHLPEKIFSKANVIMAQGTIFNVSTIIVKPLTFMNCSGFSILKILNWYKIQQANLIVVYDDMALNLGKIRYRKGGSDAGHNGIKSIIEHLSGFDNFYRLRVGIGPDPGGEQRKNFVLTPFLPEQEKLVFDTINLSVNSLEIFLKNGLDAAMNQFNGIDLSKPPKRKFAKLFIDPFNPKVDKNFLIVENTISELIKNNIYPIDYKEGF